MAETSPDAVNSVDALIAQLQLSAHPEGGWFRETWRAPAGAGASDGARDVGRAGGTAILFALRAGEASHWHTVDAEELWFWQGGDPLILSVARGDAGPVETIRLGGDVAAGDHLQGIVPKGAWQAARSVEDGVHRYSLVSCVVVPGFEFSGFTLAPPGWEPGA